MHILFLAINPSVSLAHYLPNLYSYSHTDWCIGSQGTSDYEMLESVVMTA